MANFDSFADLLLVLEGGFVNDKADKGGATKFGITLATWKQFGYDKNGDGIIDARDVQLITKEEARKIAKKQYWDYFHADQIQNQSIASIIVDWGYNSGTATAAMLVQKILNLKASGRFDNATLSALNNASQKDLFDQLKAARKAFYDRIVAKNPSQQKFYKGWMSRINHFVFSDFTPPGE